MFIFNPCWRYPTSTENEIKNVWCRHSILLCVKIKFCSFSKVFPKTDFSHCWPIIINNKMCAYSILKCRIKVFSENFSCLFFTHAYEKISSVQKRTTYLRQWFSTGAP